MKNTKEKTILWWIKQVNRNRVVGGNSVVIINSTDKWNLTLRMAHFSNMMI